MAKLADAIAAANTVRKGPQCRIGTALDKMPSDLANDLRLMLADAAVMTSAIETGLRAEAPEFAVAGSSIGRHRRGQCGCAR